MVFVAAKVKPKTDPCATVHILRHGFATPLPEKGVDLRYIRELLRHESSETTGIPSTSKKRAGIK